MSNFFNRFTFFTTSLISLILGTACPLGVEEPGSLEDCVEAGANVSYCCEHVSNKGVYPTKDDGNLCGCLLDTKGNLEACCAVHKHGVCPDNSTTGGVTEGDSSPESDGTPTTGPKPDLPDNPTTSTSSTSSTTGDQETGDSPSTGEEETGNSSATGEECQPGTEDCPCFEKTCFPPLKCYMDMCICLLGSEGCPCDEGACLAGSLCNSDGICIPVEQLQPPTPQK